MIRSDLHQQLAQWHSDSFGWALRCCAHDALQAEEVLQKTYLKILEGRVKNRRVEFILLK